MSGVYIAAASSIEEMARARRWTEALRSRGVEVASTWIDVIAAVGDGNPREATKDQRKAWALNDLVQVQSATWFWFLVPPIEVATRGAWAELGLAWAEQKAIVCSGDTRQSIFCSLGVEAMSDDEAFAWLTAAVLTP